jgi:hypothetical protein
MKKIFFITGLLMFSMTEAQSSSLSTYEINAIVGYRSDSQASPIHVFEGFGYHADFLIGELDLKKVDTIPAKYKETYKIGLDQFAGIKMNYEYKPTCNGTDEDREFRQRAQVIAKPLQARIYRDEKILSVHFYDSELMGLDVKVAEVFFPEIRKTFKFVTDHPFEIAYRRAQLSCDFDAGGGARSANIYRAEMKCDFSRIHSKPDAARGSYAISLSGSTGTLTDLLSGHTSQITQNRVGYTLDQPFAGYSSIYPYVPVNASAREKYFLINGGVYVCK